MAKIGILTRPKIKVLMVGGRRCGKSSILASLVKQLWNNVALSQYVRITQRRDGNIGAPLDKKQNDLESFMLNNPRGSYFLVDFNADDTFSHYTFQIQGPNWGTFLGIPRQINIEFVDCPGESYSVGARVSFDAELQSQMPECDIFLIAVDTPYLMDPKSDSGKFKNVNEVISITNLFEQLISFNTEYDYKKVIFVPVKCEAWKNDLDQVVKKLQGDEYYGPLMRRLEMDQRWSYSVIPAITAGGIKFSEFLAPELLNGQKCSRLGSRYVRMEDGSQSLLKSEDKVVPNDGFIFFFPYYSWFQNVGDYQPENCDQICFHVLRFLVYKIKECSKHESLPQWMLGLPSIVNMNKMIADLESHNLLKDSGNGIVNLRKIE